MGQRTTQYADDGIIMECIYDTLNEHNIEIPFPQREITIKNVTTEELGVKKQELGD